MLQVRTDCGTYGDFVMRFTPDIQTVLSSKRVDFVECYKMKYPSLGLIGHTYTNEATIEWLKIQFLDLNNFVGVKEKLNTAQINQLAGLFFFDCYFLNIAEVALFFLKYKLGKFGEFFGVIDPLKIMNAKNQFIQDRKASLDYYKDKERQEKEEQFRESLPNALESLNQYRKEKRKRIFNLKKKRIRK